MRKALLSILTVALLIVTMAFTAVPSHAEGTDRITYRMQDHAHLMTESEVTALQDKINALVDKYGLDLVIITVENMADYGYSDIVAFADDSYDEYGYGEGDDFAGMLFVIAMEEREWAISTCGRGIDCYTDAGQAYIMAYVKPQLSSGNYYEAFNTLVDKSAEAMEAYKTGGEFPPEYTSEISSGSKEPYNPATGVAAFIIIGLIVAFIYTGILKGQLKSVRYAANANNYIDENSVDINVSKDTFLYASVTKTVRETKSSGGGSSTHTSSSGRSHGGSHGSF
jgi:uncharacterized protein